MLEKQKAVSLRTVADRVGLAPCSVSAVLNNTPASWAIPQRTKDRVFRAAAQLNYRPNFYARSLRTKRTHMVAVVSADFGRTAIARVVAGVERELRRRGYLLVLATFDNVSEWSTLSGDLQQRGTEGMIVVGSSLPGESSLPIVFVDPGYASLHEPVGEREMFSLSQLAESAVQAMIAKIEAKVGPAKAALSAQLPEYFPASAVQRRTSATMGLAGD